MPRIHASAAHAALTRLLKELAASDTSGLRDRAKPRGRTKTVAQWQQQVRTTLREIAEWCPDPPFVFELPPRTRGRRTTRARR